MTDSQQEAALIDYNEKIERSRAAKNSPYMTRRYFPLNLLAWRRPP